METMTVEKITNKYTLTQEGILFTVDMGSVKMAEDKTVELILSGVEDSTLFTIEPKCGCTTNNNLVLDKQRLSVKLTYKDCDMNFAKTVVVKYKNVQLGLIKLTGRCN
jgi:hypothetical protein